MGTPGTNTSAEPVPPENRGDVPAHPACPVPKFWRRLGVTAFLFFLIKGLLWLIIPGLIATGFISDL